MNYSPRARVFALLEEEGPNTRGRLAVKVTLLAAIIIGTTLPILDTVETIDAAAHGLYGALTVITIAIFTAEYLLRLWSAPEGVLAADTPPWRARLAYARSAFGIFDLLAFAPFYVALLWPAEPQWISALYILRVLKLARHAPALSLFAAVLRAESGALLSTFMILGVLLVLESAVMYALERDAQPRAFGSIPAAMWWAVVTIASVGYGDVVPITPLGKLFASGVLALGVAAFALPAGILATGFANELRKRDFLVSWHTVARLPLFAGLEAAQIAEIARLLRHEVVPERYAVVRRGETADAMYFIQKGQVEVDVAPHPVRLGPGDYFGEIALLNDTVRTATVTTISECELLVLDVADFRRLLDARPDLRETIARVAAARQAAHHAAGDRSESH